MLAHGIASLVAVGMLVYDEDKIDDIYDYFMNSHTDNIDEALKELDDDYTEGSVAR